MIEVPEPMPSKQRFVVLDTLRGYAAIVIVLYHYKAVRPLFASYLAVDFFLILSGFVLTHAYFSQPNFRFWPFVQARFARLYPLHLLTLITSAGVYLLVGRYLDKSDFLLHALMIHNIGIGPDSIEFNSPSWSISVEFWVNVALGGALLWCLPSLKSRWIRWGVLLGVSYLAFIVLALHAGHLNAVEDNVVPLVNAGLLRGLASFCIGIVIYELFVFVKPKLDAAGYRLISRLTPMVIVLFVMSLLNPAVETAADFLYIPFFAGVVFLAAFERGVGVAQLGRFAYLGSISFALYLVHRPIQQFFVHILDGTGGLAAEMGLSLVVIFAAAHLAHRYFELPMNRLVKRLLERGGHVLRRQFRRY